MDDFNAINDVVDESIRNSSYITVLISSGIYILYTLITRLIDLFKAKDKNKPILQMAESIKEVTENVVKLNAVLDKQFQNAEIKEANKVRNIIGLAFDSFRANVSVACNEIIIHNNIEVNATLIKGNLFKIISNEYYKLYNVFSSYEIDGINVATKIKDEWIDETSKECVDIIYNNQDAITRIAQISNRLDVITNEHSIYVNNKIFNH